MVLTAVITTNQPIENYDISLCKIYDNENCDTVLDVNWEEVQIPRLIASYNYSDLLRQIEDLQNRINVLNSHKEIIDSSRE